tara:strand:- start:3536 stop:3703 length:168 start_codon:yes stop_codon:yes gene_type:complete
MMEDDVLVQGFLVANKALRRVHAKPGKTLAPRPSDQTYISSIAWNAYPNPQQNRN